MILKTQRLTIRRIVEDDWRAAQRIWQDFGASQYVQYDSPHPTDDAGVQARIFKWAKYSESMEHMFFAICLEGEMIGYIAFNIRENGYEIGYTFHSSAHGKGYAKEAHLALFDYLRGKGVTHVSAGTAINNLPSIRLLKSLGFTQTGDELVSFYKDQNGRSIYFHGGIFERNL